MTPEQAESFLRATRDAASMAHHVWPSYAACEVALESAWGDSELYLKGWNGFGLKQSAKNPRFGTLDLPTHEFYRGHLVETMAHWVSYPSLQACFEDRMALLKRLAPAYPHYAAALGAPDGETFIREVSQTWSTDSERASKVLAIYAAHAGVF